MVAQTKTDTEHTGFIWYFIDEIFSKSNVNQSLCGIRSRDHHERVISRECASMVGFYLAGNRACQLTLHPCT